MSMSINKFYWTPAIASTCAPPVAARHYSDTAEQLSQRFFPQSLKYLVSILLKKKDGQHLLKTT